MWEVAHLGIVEFAAPLVYSFLAIEPELVNIVNFGVVEVDHTVFVSNEFVLEELFSDLASCKE